MERLFNSDVWQMAFESFITSIFNISGSEQSRSRYTSVLRAFFSDPERSPENYSRADVEAYLARGSTSTRNYGKPIAIGTRNSRLAILASWYKYCSTYTVDTDGQPTALLQRLPPTTGLTYGKPPKKYRSLSIPEIQALFSVIGNSDVRSKRDRCIYLWLLMTCKRRTEVTSLSWKDVSPGPPITFTYYSKGNARQQKRQELPRECYDALIAYLVKANRLDTIKPEDPLFLSLPPRRGGNYRNTGKRLSGHWINKNLQRYCALAGITDFDRVSVHSLRHSGSRLRFSQGQDLLSISRILGHRSVVTTQHYCEDLAGIADPGLPLLQAALADVF